MTSIIKVDTIQTSAGGTPTASSLGIGGVGKIGQVVYGSTTTQVGSTSSTYADTNLSASITPSSASSKVLVLISMNCFIIGGSASSLDINIVRDSTTVIEYDRALYKADSATETQLFFQYLDSPSTTGATNYKSQMRRGSGAETVLTTYADSNGQSISTITLMEVLA
tara:strand:- start:996 stop:1496 length:501 start_codon:yes stop_codon:yes gene_type:complete